MSHPIKTLSQLLLILKGFRKEKQLTQAAMGEHNRHNWGQLTFRISSVCPLLLGSLKSG